MTSGQQIDVQNDSKKTANSIGPDRVNTYMEWEAISIGAHLVEKG